MPALSEQEEFEFRLRAEKEHAVAPRRAAPSPATPAGAAVASTPEPEGMSPVGLFTGAANKAIAQIGGVPVDTALNVEDLAKEAYVGLRDPLGLAGLRDPSLRDAQIPQPVRHETVPGSGQYNENLMRRAGIITPAQDPTSAAGRVAQSALMAGGSALAGRAPAGGGMARNVGSAALSGAAAQGAQEAGVGPAGQIIGSMLPGAAHQGLRPVQEVARRAMLPEGGGQSVRERIEQARRAGVTNPSGSQVTGSKALANAESTLARLPGAGGIMDTAAERRAQGMHGQVTDMARDLAPGGQVNAEKAGRALSEGVEGAMDNFRANQKKLYDKVDTLVPADRPIKLRRYRGMLNELAKPTPGAEATSKVLTPADLHSLHDALETDLAAVAPREEGAPEQGGVRKTVMGRDKGSLTRIDRDVPVRDLAPEGRDAKISLPYESVAGLRSRLGRMLEDNALLSTAPKSAYRKLYRALSDDVRSALPEGTPERAAWDRANQYTRAGHDRIDNVYQPLTNAKTYEKATAAAFSGTREGASGFRKIMGALTPDQRNAVAAHVIEKMGTATASTQNAEGTRFEPQTFLTNWNKMDAGAKRALFTSPRTREDLDAVVKTIGDMRDSGRGTYNPSGTARAVTHAGMAGGVTTAILDRLFAGRPVAAAGVAAGAATQVLVTRQLARAMTSPEFIHWLAEGTKAPIVDQRAYLARLITIAKNTRDPETADALSDIATTLTAP